MFAAMLCSVLNKARKQNFFEIEKVLFFLSEEGFFYFMSTKGISPEIKASQLDTSFKNR